MGSLLSDVGRYLLAAIVTAINAVVAAVGGLIGAVLSVLPDLPSVPQPPDSGFLHAFAWVMPIGGMVAMLALFTGLYVTVLLVRVVLRWAKAL